MQQVLGAGSFDSPPGGNSLQPAGKPDRYVINLGASTTPAALVPPVEPELRRHSVFVSRQLEAGRERFRLHLGYFASREAAEQVLHLARQSYPAAWVGIEPARRLPARSPAPLGAAAATSEAAAIEDTAASDSLEQVRATIAALAEPALSAPQTLALLESAPPPPVVAATAAQPGLRAARSSTALAGAAGASPAGDRAAKVAALARPAAGNATAARTARAKPTGKVASAAAANAPAYVVQLRWSPQPIDMAQVPRLAVFGAYRLYGAECLREGQRWYGLRLGFFDDPLAARQVAQYVRPEFGEVTVIGVSQRERDRASRSRAQPLPEANPRGQPAPDLQLVGEGTGDTVARDLRPSLLEHAETRVEVLRPKQPAVVPVAAVAPAAGLAAAPAPGPKPRKPPGKRAKLRVAQGQRPAAKRPGQAARESLEATVEAVGLGAQGAVNGRLVGDVASPGALALQPVAGASRLGRLFGNLARRFSGG